MESEKDCSAVLCYAFFVLKYSIPNDSSNGNAALRKMGKVKWNSAGMAIPIITTIRTW